MPRGDRPQVRLAVADRGPLCDNVLAEPALDGEEVPLPGNLRGHVHRRRPDLPQVLGHRRTRESLNLSIKRA